MKLKDKRVVITGASSGIGRAIAIRAAKDGATVILASRNVKKLEEVKKEVDELGGVGIVVPTDVTVVNDIRNLFLEATKDGAVVDVVFNNAGLAYIAPIHMLTEEQIKRMIDVNATGMIMVGKFASEVLVRQKYGHMIMTSSLAGLISLPDWSVYVATKWAITGFADSIRMELAKHGVQISTLHPGAVRTDFFDEAGIGIEEVTKGTKAIEPSDVADAVYDKLFTDTQKILVPGIAKPLAFLYRLVPGLAQGVLKRLSDDTVDTPVVTSEDEPGFGHVEEVD